VSCAVLTVFAGGFAAAAVPGSSSAIAAAHANNANRIALLIPHPFVVIAADPSPGRADQEREYATSAFHRRHTSRVLLIVLLSLLALLVTGMPGSTTPTASPSTRSPSIRPLSLTPLTLQGTGFVPGEAVRIELLPGRGRKSAVRAARATAIGSFRVPYGLVALEPCRGFILARATGSSGSRATWKRACRPPHEEPPSLR
jgi:hypothetical protein